jgi:hypothetical protein
MSETLEEELRERTAKRLVKEFGLPQGMINESHIRTIFEAYGSSVEGAEKEFCQKHKINIPGYMVLRESFVPMLTNHMLSKSITGTREEILKKFLDTLLPEGIITPETRTEILGNVKNIKEPDERRKKTKELIGKKAMDAMKAKNPMEAGYSDLDDLVNDVIEQRFFYPRRMEVEEKKSSISKTELDGIILKLKDNIKSRLGSPADEEELEGLQDEIIGLEYVKNLNEAGMLEGIMHDFGNIPERSFDRFYEHPEFRKIFDKVHKEIKKRDIPQLRNMPDKEVARQFFEVTGIHHENVVGEQRIKDLRSYLKVLMKPEGGHYV